MTTTDPLSLAQTKRLASRRRHDPAARDAPGRPRDPDRRVPAARRRRPGVPPRVGRGRRAARPLLVPRRRAAAAPRGPRRRRPDPDPAGDGPDLRAGPADRTRRRAGPARRHPRVRAAPPRRCRSRGCRGSPAAPSARSPTTRSPRSSRRVPLPDRDPVGVPMAAFIETDLVLVFDHLTHTLSAIASLHTEAPDLEGRYRIAEAAIFEALERTSRPSAAELAGARAPGNGGRARRTGRRRSTRASAATRTSTRSRSPRTRSPPARRSRSCWPGASRSTCRPTPRPARRSTASRSIGRSAA